MSMKQTLDGKQLPRHLKMFRDEDSGRVELRYWRFQPILLFQIPFMAVWSGELAIVRKSSAHSGKVRHTVATLCLAFAL